MWLKWRIGLSNSIRDKSAELVYISSRKRERSLHFHENSEREKNLLGKENCRLIFQADNRMFDIRNPEVCGDLSPGLTLILVSL